MIAAGTLCRQLNGDNMYILKNTMCALNRYKSNCLAIFFVMFFCAFSLSIFCVFTDSAAHGEYLESLRITHGANLSIYPAVENDVSLFRSMDIEKIWLEEEFIYIKCKAQKDTDVTACKAAEIIDEANRDLHVRTFDPSVSYSVFEHGFVNVVKFYICVISSISIFFVFATLVEREIKESITRDKKTNNSYIYKIIYFEFWFLLFVAILLAIPLSSTVAKIVIEYYFRDIIHDNALGNVVYRYKFGTIIFELLLMLVSSAISFYSVLYRYSGYLGNCTTDKCISTDDSVNRRVISSASLTIITRRQKKKENTILVCVYSLVTLFALFEFNQIYEPDEKYLGSDFVVSDPGIGDMSEISWEDIDEIIGFSCVSNTIYSYYNNNFVEYNEGQVESSCHDIDRVAFNVFFDDDTLPKCSIASNAVYADSIFQDHYSIGDTITIKNIMTDKVFEAMIVGFYEMPNTSSYLTMLCNIDNFKKMTGIDSAPKSVIIYLNNNTSENEISELREWIEEKDLYYSDENRKVYESMEIKKRIKTISIIYSGALIISTIITLSSFLLSDVDYVKQEIYGENLFYGNTKKILFRNMLKRFLLYFMIAIAPDAIITTYKIIMHYQYSKYADLLLDCLSCLFTLFAFCIIGRKYRHKIIGF